MQTRLDVATFMRAAGQNVETEHPGFMNQDRNKLIYISDL